MQKQPLVLGGIGGLLAIVIGVSVALGFYNRNDGMGDRCSGKSDAYCRALKIQDCQRELDTFADNRDNERNHWRQDHEKELATPEGQKAYQEFVQDQNADRRRFLADFREGKCKVMFETAAAGTETVEVPLEDAGSSAPSFELDLGSASSAQ